jgi:hypothetical protein
MNKHNVVQVAEELKAVMKKINARQACKALRVPLWKTRKRRKIKQALRETAVWLFGESLLASHPDHARHAYHYAQVAPGNKRIKKYFLYGKWHAVCATTSMGETGTSYHGVAELIAQKFAEPTKDQAPQPASEAATPINEYLVEVRKQFDDVIKNADLSDAQTRFLDQALRTLDIREMGGKERPHGAPEKNVSL